MLHIRNCTIFDGSDATLREGHDIFIEGDEIREISERPIASSGVQTIDAGGNIVMPGFIDAHFHAYATTARIAETELTHPTLHAHQTRPILEAALQRGFTTVRDAAGGDAGLAAAIESGLIEGPRMFFGGKALSMSGGHGDKRQAYEPCGCGSMSRLSQVVDGVDNVRRATRENLRQGAHHIKIFVSGGVASPTDPIWSNQYSDDEIRAIVEEAKARRTYVLAHAYTAESIARAVACGVRSIEHGNLIDAKTAKAVAAADAYVVPTLVTYEALAAFGAEALPPSGIEKLNVVRAAGLNGIEECRRAGVKLGFGTDLLGPMHAWQSREFGFRAQVEKPIDVLRSATSINAELLQQSGRIGTIAPGAKADLLIVDGNPLENIQILEDPERTILVILKDGRVAKNAL